MSWLIKLKASICHLLYSNFKKAADFCLNCRMTHETAWMGFLLPSPPNSGCLIVSFCLCTNWLQKWFSVKLVIVN